MTNFASSVGESVKALSSSVQWQQGLQVVVPCLLHHLGLPCGFPFLQLCCDSAAEVFLQPRRVINAVAATTAFNLASYAKEAPWVATKGQTKTLGCMDRPTQINTALCFQIERSTSFLQPLPVRRWTWFMAYWKIFRCQILCHKLRWLSDSEVFLVSSSSCGFFLSFLDSWGLAVFFW